MKHIRPSRAHFAAPDSWPPTSLQLSAEAVAELDDASRSAYQSRSVNYQIAVELVLSSWSANQRLIELVPSCWSRTDYLKPHIGLPPTWESEIMLHQSQSSQYLRMIISRLEAALDDGLISTQVLQGFIEFILRDLLAEHQYTLEWNGKVLLIKRVVESQPPAAA